MPLVFQESFIIILSTLLNDDNFILFHVIFDVVWFHESTDERGKRNLVSQEIISLL